MFKRFFAATLSCTKKIFAACATFAVKAAKKIQSVLIGAKNLLIEAVTWVSTSLRKPSCSQPPVVDTTSIWQTAKAMAKAAFISRFLLFVGGLICVFVLPSDMTNGDLTWFENMLNSANNMLRDIAAGAVNKGKSVLYSLLNGKWVSRAGEVT